MNMTNRKAWISLILMTLVLPAQAVERAGTTTAYSFGDSAGQLGEYAWYRGNSGKETHPVGQKGTNGWGLYDLYGNVGEWVQDWYSREYYKSCFQRDPTGPLSGTNRVIRGGSWLNDAGGCRSASRSNFHPGSRSRLLAGTRLTNVGFRLLRAVP